MKRDLKRVSDWLFRDKKGNVVLWQRPNKLIITWAAGWLLSRLLPYGDLNFIASLVSFGALFAWAWLEIFEGASIFRRLLGTVVMCINIFNRL